MGKYHSMNTTLYQTGFRSNGFFMDLDRLLAQSNETEHEKRNATDHGKRNETEPGDLPKRNDTAPTDDTANESLSSADNATEARRNDTHGRYNETRVQGSQKSDLYVLRAGPGDLILAQDFWLCCHTHWIVSPLFLRAKL